jgi:hypothetical protein
MKPYLTNYKSMNKKIRNELKFKTTDDNNNIHSESTKFTKSAMLGNV